MHVMHFQMATIAAEAILSARAERDAALGKGFGGQRHWVLGVALFRLESTINDLIEIGHAMLPFLI